MKLTRNGVASVAVLCTLGLVGGGAALVSPASASAGVNWGHIFKKEIKPRADKRYYTKKKANSLFSVKSALLNYYTKAESDAKYATPASVAAALGGYYTKAQSDTNYYTKAQSDAKYAPYPTLIRGAFIASGLGSPEYDSAISFGFAFSTVPTVHFINAGALMPIGCSGTVDAPNAAPGNLCIFERAGLNQASRGYISEGVQGGYVFLVPATLGSFAFTRGTWAARPTGLASTAGTAASSSVTPQQHLAGVPSTR